MSKRTTKVDIPEELEEVQARQADKAFDQPHHGHDEREEQGRATGEGMPEAKQVLCSKCKKPVAENNCGIDGQQLSYCVPEGETMSESEKSRLATQQANVRK